MLIDPSGRTLDYLRVSVTDRCDLRCRFCMPAEGVALRSHEQILRHEEIAAVVEVAVEEGVRSVRLTGGEPLTRRGILSLVAQLAAIPGLDDLAMTTNGRRLGAMAAELKAAGLRRVNVGLPSLDPTHYREITRREGDPAALVAGLEAAMACGLTPVKLNVPVLRGLTDHLDPMVELARRLPVEIRFIEYMPLGDAPSDVHHMRPAELRARIAAAVERVTGARVFGEVGGVAVGRGPASDRMAVPGGLGHLAIIAGATGHICASCNRLRLTADGRLRLCLFSDTELDLTPALRPRVDREGLRALLHQAAASKPFQRVPLTPNHRLMAQIGG